ncbi:MAG: NeuD/PglB/VioB family sugar acetyltransferase [Methylosarcina sp.]
MNPNIEMSAEFDLLIYGCGGHARSVIDVLVHDKPDISLCIIDDQAQENEIIAGFPVFREEKHANRFFLAIGDNYKRAEALRTKPSQNLISIISGKSHIGKHSEISRGVFIGNFVHVGPEAVIGMNSIINNGAIVEHEVQVGAHCHVGPNASISGRCKIDDFVFIGVGATVIDSISICSNVVIGGGSVVVQNITEPGTYAGCPAKRIK